MFVWLRRQSFESSVNKVFQKEKLINSKTKKIYSPLKEVSSAGANLVHALLANVINGTARILAFSLIIEGTTEKVLKFLMPILSNFNPNLGFNGKNVFLDTSERSKQ
jgi:hypothetical protein